MAASSKPVAGERVAHGQREKAEPEGQQDQVQHLDAPSDTQSLVGTRWRPYRCALTSVKSAKYFSPEAIVAPCEQRLRGTHRHKISRWKQGRRYRILIKMRRHDLPMTRFIFGTNRLE